MDFDAVERLCDRYGILEAPLKTAGIIWLHRVINKLGQKHQVDQTEVEQVFRNRPQFRRG